MQQLYLRVPVQLCLHTCVSDVAFICFLTSYVCFGTVDLLILLAILQLHTFPVKQIPCNQVQYVLLVE